MPPLGGVLRWGVRKETAYSFFKRIYIQVTIGGMQLIKEFLEHLEIERGRSRRTIDNYGRYLMRFLKFSQIDDPAYITDDVVRQYRLWLNRENLDRKTQNYHLIALRGFLKYLIKRNVASLTPEKIELAKTSAREIDLIDEEDMERLLKAPNGQTTRDLRDKALLELLFSTGLRVSELCSLDKDTVNLNKDEFSIRGKGGKIRVVFISKNAKDSVREYLAKRGDINPALFVSIPRGKSKTADPTRLTQRSVQRMIKFYAIKAGIPKKVTPHTLRHLFATDLLANGADLRSVQTMLGHSSITTTQVYTHITDKQLKEVHQAFHGRRRQDKED